MHQLKGDEDCSPVDLKLILLRLQARRCHPVVTVEAEKSLSKQRNELFATQFSDL